MDISTLTKHVTELAENVPQDVAPNEKFALFHALNKLRDALEAPFDKVARIMFAVRVSIVTNTSHT
jgi:hypothetical protein